MTRLQWLICATAGLGFLFDIYELLMLPLVVGPALADFGIAAGSPAQAQWIGRLFYVPALAGGIFGLLGGWLTDVLGRRRVLTGSILLYAFAAAASAFVHSPESLLFFRCLTFVGVSVEFVAAVAWLAELFDDRAQAEAALGYTQALGSLGGFLVSGAYRLSIDLAPHLPEIAGSHAPWRYTLLSGLVPAIGLMLVRPFLPESPVWERRRAEGTLGRPSVRALFSPALALTTVVTTLLVAASFGVAFGALQQLPRIVPGLPELAGLDKAAVQRAVSDVQLWQEAGGLVGRLILAYAAVHVLRRRWLYWAFQIPGLFVVPLVFATALQWPLSSLKGLVFVSGALTVGLFSFWGNYLPRVYPVGLRGTGEAFAANVGGRMLGTWAAWVATSLAASGLMAGWLPQGTPPAKLALAAAVVAGSAHGIAAVVSLWLPREISATTNGIQSCDSG